MQAGNIFEIAILELGRRDGEWAEVVSGLKSGQKYATENSFIIKADIGKSGATHDH
jgi:cobalt-zinc-cadmium efflux system membrane fusion protein